MKGTVNLIGKTYQNSGFKLLISDEEDIQKHFEEISQFLVQDTELLQELKENKIDAVCDIGFTIDAPSNVARFIDIDKELIRQIADANIGLSISSYLADEDDET